jgi:uracil DNA glycosylase
MIIEISLINTQSWMKVLTQKNLYVESLLKKLTKTKSDQCVLEEKKNGFCFLSWQPLHRSNTAILLLEEKNVD